jgi:hypothetical protein
MRFSLVIDPTIMDGGNFVGLWNGDPELSKIARAEAGAVRRDFGLDPQVAAFLVGVGSSIAASVIYDAIRSFFRKKGIEITVDEYEETKAPDGTKTVILRRKTSRG